MKGSSECTVHAINFGKNCAGETSLSGGNKQQTTARLEMVRRAKITPRQAEVLAHLSRVTSDQSRHEPQFRLDGMNVTVQIRSLLRSGIVLLEQGRLTRGERQARVEHSLESVIDEMRALMTMPGE